MTEDVISKFVSFKTDTRPKKHGWAPGNYTCKCSECGCDFVGDKRATMCADCAYSKKIEKIANKKAKVYRRSQVIDLHIANPTLSDTKLGKHFGIAPATAGKYVKQYKQTIEPAIDFYNELLLLAKEISATRLVIFFKAVLGCIKAERFIINKKIATDVLDFTKPEMDKIFACCVKADVLGKRLSCCSCGMFVLGDFPQCPQCKISKFETVYEIMPKYRNINTEEEKVKQLIYCSGCE